MANPADLVQVRRKGAVPRSSPPTGGDVPISLFGLLPTGRGVTDEQRLIENLRQSGQDARRGDRLALIGELRSALDRDELVLHFQPKIVVESGRTCGVEALVRWQHPTRGLMQPDDFVPLAEQTGLIDQLSRWVLGAAMKQWRAWSDDGLRLEIAINLSMRNLRNPLLPTRYRSF